MIDHNDKIPLYQQLIDELRSSLLCGEIQPGERIPTEKELSERYAVSRITVRKAIEVLSEEGLVVKKQGKGTFAEKPKFERKIIDPVSFSASCTYKGMRPGSKLIQRFVRSADGAERKALGLSQSDEILYIQRLRFVDNEPLLIENNYFPFPEYGFLLERDIDAHSLYETICAETGKEISKAHKTIEITSAAKSEADLLQVKIGSPLFYLRGIVYDENDRPVHLTAQFIRGDRFKLVL
jgi:GntR family transcriptional regulator